MINLDFLNEIDVQVLAWYYYDDLSYQQIADYLKISRVSVKERIDKCRRKLTEHKIPLPKRTPHPPQGKRINLTESLMDELATKTRRLDYEPR